MAMNTILNHDTTPSTTPPVVNKLNRYVDRIERARQAAREAARNHIEGILSEAREDGLDQDVIRLLARERRMAHALDKFLARRHVSCFPNMKSHSILDEMCRS
ncbi:MAG: hypothetical protein HQL84_01605 [Magnetococcales bacterium]|nr:hypothetical protein [Magnetococcales bacterium]MBF0148722.1 hypothetical protein [Magnetococcales bacterium]MBF0173256.1 hypothetical protein [Magnetococcales bacterium]MBF0348504.1 hypothetical protein [Magnetococcales bacterium]MBF0630271.1 hypothetical protein [Magnetococcales bacterium]